MIITASPDLDIVSLDAAAVRASVRVVSQVGASDLARPTRWQPGAAFARPVPPSGAGTASLGGRVLDEIVAWLGRRPGWPELP